MRIGLRSGVVQRRIWMLPVIAWLLMVVLIVIGAIVIAAVSKRQMSLDDGSVWLLSQEHGAVVRLNIPSQEPTARVDVDTANLDLHQHDSFTAFAQAGRITVVDEATIEYENPMILPDDVTVHTGGGSVAFLHARTGMVWAISESDSVNAVFPKEPSMELGDGGKVTVSSDGSIWGYRPHDGMVLKLDDASDTTIAFICSLTSEASMQADSFTVVGEEPAMLSGHRVYTKHGVVEVSSLASPITLQSSPHDAVQQRWLAVAGLGQMAVIDFDALNEPPVVLDSGQTGEPAVPVSLNGCVYGAWQQKENNYLSVCDPNVDADMPGFRSLHDIESSSDLVFRVNHGYVALNNITDGTAWAPSESVAPMDIRWDDIAGQDGTQEQDIPQSTANAYNTMQDCIADTVPVIANDDEFTVRRGRIQILDVLHNDVQSDCSVLRIERIGRIQTSGQTASGQTAAMQSTSKKTTAGRIASEQLKNAVDIALAYDGRFLQFDASNAADGSVRFTYEISNGIGQTAQAYVTVNIHDDDNHAPQRHNVPIEYRIEQDGILQFNVLEGFFDPDGDALMLTRANVIGQTPAQLSTRSDGLVEFMPNGAPIGRVDVEAFVSDGIETCKGTISVLIRENGTLPALLDPVSVTAFTMTPTTIDMTEHIHATGASSPYITDVQTDGNTNVSLLKGGLGILFETQSPGIHYLSYSVLQGTVSSTGRVRIDVRTSSGEDAALPLAVNDVTVLNPSGETIIAPLLNDIDPTGGVPAIIDVEDPSNTISHAIVENRVHLISRETLEIPIDVTYTIANRYGNDVGTITVLPNNTHHVSGNTMHAPNIEVQVRTEGLVSIKVLNHIIGTHERTLSLESVHPTNPDIFQGLAFISGDVVRYQANAASGHYELLYTVHDDLGNIASGTIDINVHDSDAAHKAKPVPDDIETQAEAGSQTRIPIDLTGTDTDGDDLQLLGLGNTAPTLGRITTVGADYMMYEAYPDSRGTDIFTYAVEDWTGQRAQGTIQVAVFQENGSTNMLARNDTVTLRPSSTSTVQVTANDLSSDESNLVVDEHLESVDIPNAQVLDDDSIFLTAPQEIGTYHIVYRVHNDAGLSASAVLTVIVDPDASIAPPIAYDYQVPPSETVDKRTITVDMSPWVVNPSGSQNDLSISVHPSAAERARISAHNTMAVSIDLTEKTSFIPYVVTDTVHGLTATAFIQVPAYGVFPPTLRPKAPVLSVEAGDSLEININDHVRVGVGKQPIIDPLSVSATKASNTDFVKDSSTLVFTAESDYSGPASLTFTVSDGRFSEDTAFINTSTLTLSISVSGKQVVPPTFTDTVIDIMPGEDPLMLDLFKLTRAYDDSDFSYSGGGHQNGVTVTVQQDGLLNAQASFDTAIGGIAHFPITITYSQGVVHAGISVRIVASDRPLANASVPPITIAAGSKQTTDVFQHAFNPFPETPLTLVDCSIDHAAFTVSCTDDGVVSITAAEHIDSGTYTAHFIIDDATGSAERRVTEIFNVTVINVPQTPRLLEKDCDAGNGMVMLRWNAGASNGSPITGFEVSWSGPNTGTKSCGVQTACTIDQLRNGQQYHFVVRAINAVGASPDSNTVSLTPDQLPSAPTGVEIRPGYQTVIVHWNAPQGDFSQVVGYRITLIGLPSGSIAKEASATASSASFDISHSHIHDGMSVTAVVEARNAVGYGPESRPSSPAFPWSTPDMPNVHAYQAKHNGNSVIVSGTLSDLRNTTCSEIALHLENRSAVVPCAAPSHAFTLTSDDYFTDLSVSITLRTEETSPITNAGEHVHPTYEPTPPARVSIIPRDNHCIVTWDATGTYHDAFVLHVQGEEHTVKSESYQYEIQPWSPCGTVSVQQTFKKRVSEPASATNNDMANKQPAIISLSMRWDDRNTINATMRNITYGQTAILVVTVYHEGETAYVTRIPALQTAATFDLSRFEGDGIFTWSVHLENGEPELIDSVRDQGIVTSRHMNQRPEALSSDQGLAQGTGLVDDSPISRPRSNHDDDIE